MRDTFDRGHSRYYELIWYLFKMAFFLSSFPWPSRLKVFILKLFGASVGHSVCIKPRVNIHMPWRLTLGDKVSIGEEVYILNFESIVIEREATVSQRAFLCGGNHDFRDPGFVYRNGPIHISEGAWVGANVFIGPNVRVGVDTIVSAGSVVFKDLDSNSIHKGNPCEFVGHRWR
jgi:putative colanic acid biosynthesis acetyltransferase WcaF